MVPGISVYKNLPTPLKIGLSVIAGGSIVGALMFLVPSRLLWIIFIGLAVVALILLLYWRLLKWFKKKKAAPMAHGMIENASAAPQGVSDAAHLAKLDDLRKKFEEGVSKFQAAGKSLYNFPWYMIVGEPGSGKTEAVRHCNVGFPPGLQDQFQGAGGTLNMNWWFTDHAVIVDTAGRLMFEEVETGGSAEWKEFLKLLKKYRPRCPINGVFLVIPADSLIKDTADEIEQKASKIARQFDVIQRVLDVRFPVFVVITKSDLANGFRDFFDNLDDPQLQHQILGWSNPAPLDEPYNPDFVDQHLKTIQKRLFRRRLALLQEIVSESGEPGVEKLRATDTLYAFPQSLAKISPRMARYLELIFSVGSQWSGKPLFFRGIYFTSSMREGSALDEDLAESLGVSVDTLPDGRVWERDRAYFLRDLFIKKVFREKGLVTYATNAKKQHLHRKAIVMISAAASVVFLLLFTFYATFSFRRSIGDMKKYFEAPAKLIAASSGAQDAGQLRVIKHEGQQGYRYVGRAGIPEMPDDIVRSNLSEQIALRVDQWEKKGVPWIFAPAAKFAKGITPEKLKTAQAVIYETAILRPFLGASSRIMDDQKNGQWRRENMETRVLSQLIRLKANKTLDKEGEYSSKAFLDPFFAYIFRSDASTEDEEGAAKRLQMYKEDKAELHLPIEYIYGETLSPAFSQTEPNFLETAIENGVNLFNTYWSDSNQVGTRSRDFAQVGTIEKLRDAFGKFDTAEMNILALKDRIDSDPGKAYTDERWEQFVGDWDKNYKNLFAAREAIQNLAGSINNPPSLGKLWANVAVSTLQDVNDHYQLLLTELKTEKAEKSEFLVRMRKKLEANYGVITDRLVNSQFADELRLIDERFYAQVRDKDRLYEIRFQMYSKCNDQFVETKAYALNEVRSAIQKVDDGVGEARDSIGGLLALAPTVYRFKQAADICRVALGLPQQRGLYSVVDSSLNSAPKNIKDVGDFVAKQGKWDWTDLPPNVIDRRYDPKAAEDVLSGWNTLRDTLQRIPKEARLQEQFRDANEIYAEYPRLYFEYWLGTVPEFMIRSSVDRDSVQFKSLIVRNVFDELVGDLGGLLEKAITPLRPYVPQGEERIKQFDANIDKVNDSRQYDKFYSECRTVLNNWRELSDDISVSRMTLLKIKPADYLEDYAPFSYRSPAEFVDMYWAEFTLKLLGILSDKVQDQGKKAFDNLRTQSAGKFPLERDSDTNLTQKELVDAWTSLNDVRLQEVFDQGAIGAGAETRYDKIDEQLNRLRGMLLPEAYKQWFEGIERIFQSLPQAEDPYYCKITLLGQNEQRKLVRQNENLLLDYLTECRLVQGDHKSERFNTRARENLSLGMFQYPGSSLQIEFYQYPSDTEVYTSSEFASPWAPLRLLLQHYDARKEGYVKLEVKSEKGLGGVLFLQLEFYRDVDSKYPVNFPKPDQWPSLKNRP